MIWPESTPLKLDVLFVIDSSPAMTPYRDALAKEMRGAVGYFGPVDLHLGVITADLGANRDSTNEPWPGQCAGWGDAAALRRSPLFDGGFIAYRSDARGIRTNLRGSLADALQAVGDVGVTGCVRAQPLEAMRIALDHDPHDAGFRRAGAGLAVIIIAAQDDASPGSPADYAAFLGPEAAAFVIAPEAPRLRAFQSMFYIRGWFELIDGLGSLGLVFEAYQSFTPLNDVVASPCALGPLLDIDPGTPGVQPECSVHDNVQVIPRCGDTVQFPCWRAFVDPGCGYADNLHFEVMRGDFDPPDNNVVVAECVAR